MHTSKSFAALALYLALLGTLLSGYLSYNTLFVSTGCTRALLTCGGTPVKILGAPQCVLGFVMFFAVLLIAVHLLTGGQPKRWWKVLVYLGIAGSLFAGGLSAYELWFRLPAPTTMPSCVFGFFLYAGILLTSVLARRQGVLSTTESL